MDSKENEIILVTETPEFKEFEQAINLMSRRQLATLLYACFGFMWAASRFYKLSLFNLFMTAVRAIKPENEPKSPNDSSRPH